MKKILIVDSSFRWGGINVALQNLLRSVDHEKVKIDLFVMVHSGTYANQFPNCTLLPKNYLIDSLLDHVHMKRGLSRLLSIGLKFINRLTNSLFQHWLYKVVGRRMVSREHYDAIIGWHEGTPTIFVSHINHDNKIAWIHCDYSNYADGPGELKYYSSFRYIVNVSKYTTRRFLDIFPSLESRCRTVYNVLDTESICTKSKESTTSDFITDRFTLISVGRVSPVKRFSQIPIIADRLRSLGCEFKWYILGPTYPGDEYELLMKNIKEYDVKDIVLLLGEKKNPYPYIAKSDVVVLTSQSEALPFVVNEAHTLGIPTVSTDFGSSYELLNEKMISSIDNIHTLVSSMILDHDKYNSIRDGLLGWDYDNKSVLSDFYALL